MNILKNIRLFYYVCRFVVIVWKLLKNIIRSIFFKYLGHIYSIFFLFILMFLVSRKVKKKKNVFFDEKQTRVKSTSYLWIKHRNMQWSCYVSLKVYIYYFQDMETFFLRKVRFLFKKFMLFYKNNELFLYHPIIGSKW